MEPSNFGKLREARIRTYAIGMLLNNLSTAKLQPQIKSVIAASPAGEAFPAVAKAIQRTRSCSQRASSADSNTGFWYQTALVAVPDNSWIPTGIGAISMSPNNEVLDGVDLGERRAAEDGLSDRSALTAGVGAAEEEVLARQRGPCVFRADRSLIPDYPMMDSGLPDHGPAAAATR
jgi:hypothetical protein